MLLLLYWWQFATSVIETAGKFAAGVIDMGKISDCLHLTVNLKKKICHGFSDKSCTSGKFTASYFDTGCIFAISVVDTGGKFAAGVISPCYALTTPSEP
jgi:hypothetical protein